MITNSQNLYYSLKIFDIVNRNIMTAASEYLSNKPSIYIWLTEYLLNYIRDYNNSRLQELKLKNVLSYKLFSTVSLEIKGSITLLWSQQLSSFPCFHFIHKSLTKLKLTSVAGFHSSTSLPSISSFLSLLFLKKSTLVLFWRCISPATS